MSRTPVSINTTAVAASARSLFYSTNILRSRLATTSSYSAALTQARPRYFSATRYNQFSTTKAKMTVHTIQGMSAYSDTLAQQKGLVVIDCFATWCGPCKAIAPKLAEWSNDTQYSNVFFVKIDVDESPDVATELSVRAMPTFMFFKDGQKVDELVGANPQKLKQLIDQHK